MKAKYLDIKKSNKIDLKEAGAVIKNGGLVLFPTETVYGIGADGLNGEAVKKIFIAKGRAQDNPLILHIADTKMLPLIAKDITKMEEKLMDAFWPGPFTLILKRTENVPDVVAAGLDTVGVRMPSSNITRELIKEANTPIAAPSANLSGKPSGTNLEDIKEELEDRVDYMIDGGECEIGLESTVVRVIDDVPHILRPGRITAEQIEEVAGKVEIDSHVLDKTKEGQKVLSPGMKYRHYAPKSKCTLVYSKDNDKMVEKIQEILNQYEKTVVIACKENQASYKANQILEIGHKDDLEEMSRHIFSALRKVDEFKPDMVVIEGTKKEGIGLAIMNRLLRACEYQYIEC